MEKRKLYIQLYSIHGLVRGKDFELGRDSDTGGQVKYVVELANELSKYSNVEKVELVTRLIKDKNVSDDYSIPKEKVNEKFDIIRISCGGGKYIRKELLWDHLEEFVDKSVKYIKSKGRLPDVIHSHYADAGYVCTELTKFFGIPFIHTGHSLGRSKYKKLLDENIPVEEIEKRYKISHRIKVEEDIIYYSDLIITSTNQEIKEQYGEYNNTNAEDFVVIPPSIDLEKFFPFTEKREFTDEIQSVRESIRKKLWTFFTEMKKPLILTLCRPDKRKNISGLITAFGEDKELQKKANLAIFAGLRNDIQTMSKNEREVLTEMLLLLDKYNLYGKMAIPKRHDFDLEVPELYRIAAETGGIFVNAALTEPFGLTLIEAAACGIPVVATDDGGPRDIIENCKNGLLVDVSNYQNISKALNDILNDKEIWNKFSINGIEGVNKFYTWKSHALRYLEEVEKIMSVRKEKKDTFAPFGKKLLSMKKLIISDIDYTLLGDDIALTEINELLTSVHQKNIGFGVATGRTIDSAINVLQEMSVPLPDVIISSVGAELYYNYEGELIYSKGWDSHISHKWNRNKIFEVLSDFDFLKYQEETTQRKFKISYYTHDLSENIQIIKDTLIKNKIKANVIFSHGQFLDILPYRASKGKAIRYLSYRWNIPYESILVAGDSGNDEEMLKGELLAVVVGNYSPELEKLRGRKRIYFAKNHFAGGIIEGINFYNFLNGV